MKRIWGQFFLTRRLFACGAALVLVLCLAFVWPQLETLAITGLGLLALLLIIDVVQLYRIRNAITARRSTLDKWSNGDENPVTLEVESRFPFTVQAMVLDELPFQFQERSLEMPATIPAGGMHTFTYMVRPTQRGIHTYGAINVLVHTQLGLALRRYKLEQGREVPVYPSYIHLRRYELMALADRYSMAGIKKVRRSAQRVEFERIREYVGGDDKRAVNWKATARRGKLMVNQYQDEKAQQIVSLIDTGRVMRMPFEGLTLLDRAINASLVLSDIAIRKDDKAGLMTFSKGVHTTLRPARERGQMRKIMEALYAQNTDFAETDFEALFIAARHNLSQRSLLVLYTNFESLNAAQRHLPYLRRLARSHLVAVVIFRNTELDDALHMPDKNLMEVYVKTITEKFVIEKQIIAKELEAHGILTILTRPQDLSTSVLGKYLEIKARGML